MLRHFVLLALVAGVLSQNVNPPTWANLHPTLPPGLGNYGAHKIVAIGEKVFEFGGLTENRTTFWLSGGNIQGWDNDAWNFIRYYDVQTNRYVIPPSSGPIPPTRAWFGMDAIGTDIYFFGGISKDFAVRGDFWRVDVSNPNHVVYHNLTKAGAPTTFPSVRVGNSLSAYVEHGKNYLVLHSGLALGPPGGDLFLDINETWIYDVSADHWSLVSHNDPNGPKGRARHAATVYNNQNLYIFGGELFDASVINPSTGTPGYVHYVGDMWRFNLDSHVWTLITPANTAPRLSLHESQFRLDNLWHFHGGDFGSCALLDLINPYTNVFDLNTNKWVSGYIPEYDSGPAIKRHECAYVQQTNIAYCSGGYMGEFYNGFLCTNAEQTYPNTVFAYRPHNMWLDAALNLVSGGHH